jgi:NDP-sugar pyrophosphorylase family protein
MNINILIPMAGNGMNSNIPKPMIDVNGKPMIVNIINNIGLTKKINNISFHSIFCVSASHVDKYKIDKILKNECDCSLVIVEKITDGPARTALLARNLINNKEKLIITNSDQIIDDFNLSNFINFIQKKKPHAVLGVFLSNHPKNSYVKLDSNFRISEIKEKEVISNIATNGFHYWENGEYFVDSADEMIYNKDMVNGEFYIAPTFNYLIKKDKIVLPYFFNMHYPIGTKEDLDKYLSICSLTK